MVCLEVLDNTNQVGQVGTREIQFVCSPASCSSCCSDSLSTSEGECCQVNGGTWDAATSTCSGGSATWTPCGCNNCGT